MYTLLIEYTTSHSPLNVVGKGEELRGLQTKGRGLHDLHQFSVTLKSSLQLKH